MQDFDIGVHCITVAACSASPSPSYRRSSPSVCLLSSLALPLPSASNRRPQPLSTTTIHALYSDVCAHCLGYAGAKMISSMELESNYMCIILTSVGLLVVAIVGRSWR